MSTTFSRRKDHCGPSNLDRTEASLLRAAIGVVVAAGSCLAAVPLRAETPAHLLNGFGMPGYVSVPAARALPDGDLALSLRLSDERRVGGLTFQISPRLTGSFRYGRLERETGVVYDRSFDLQFDIIQPEGARPGLAVGLRDFIGTGVLSSEYLVMSVSPAPAVTASLGVGWGALGAKGGLGSPFGVRPSYEGLGGEPNAKQWFRGPASVFAGLDWVVSPKLQFALEYSGEDPDGSGPETPGVFAAGLRYKIGSGFYLSGTADDSGRFGFGIDVAFSPGKPIPRKGVIAPPVTIAASAAATMDSAEVRLKDALAQQGIALLGLRIEGHRALVRLENRRYGSVAQSLGRSTRALLKILPPSIQRYELEMRGEGPAALRIEVSRDDLLDSAGRPDLGQLAWSQVSYAPSAPWQGELLSVTDPVDFNVSPYLAFSLFDPDNPLRADVGVEARGLWRLAPNTELEGRIRARALGNRGDSQRLTNSVLPPVRSDAVRYAREGDVTIPLLTLSHRANLGRNVFSRFSVGLLEEMFAGLSAEVLWQPPASRLGVGLEVAHVWQRDPGLGLGTGFYDYAVTTGHLSFYYALTDAYTLRLDLGRYLAGDAGGTVALERRFDNGWRVGAYATRTDVSFEEFGEGSFDKGIYLTVPFDWLLGRSTAARADITLQPVLRDGGARLNVSRRLYESIRPSQTGELSRTWLSFAN